MRQQEETHIMENIIYNELIVRGYSVDVGMVEIKKPDKDGKWTRIHLEVDSDSWQQEVLYTVGIVYTG